MSLRTDDFMDAEGEAKGAAPELQAKEEHAHEPEKHETKEAKHEGLAPKEAKPKAKEQKKAKEEIKLDVKMFNRWPTGEIVVNDPGIKDYIGLSPILVPRLSHGRHSGSQFHKANVNIVERLMNHLFVPGHRSKRHRLTSGTCAGSSTHSYKLILKAFEEIEKREKKNPVEVLVKAIETAALREEVSAYQIGSIIVRKAVITSPQRRVDLALRLFVQGAYTRKFNKKKGMHISLADEIIAASKGSKDSYAISEKERQEREAAGAR